MSTAIEIASHSFGPSISDIMERPHCGWAPDVFPPRRDSASSEYYPQSRSGLLSLPGPTTLFSAAPSPQSSAPSMYSQDGSFISSRRPSSFSNSVASDQATPSPVGRSPPQLPANPEFHGHHGVLVPAGFASSDRPMHGLDARLSPTRSIASSDWSDDADRLWHQQKYQQHPQSRLSHPPQHRSCDPYAYQPQPVLSSNFGLHQKTSQNTQYLHLPFHPSSPPVSEHRPGHSALPRSEAKQMSISNLLIDNTVSQMQNRSYAREHRTPPPVGDREPKPHSRLETTSNAPMLSPARSASSFPEYQIRVRQQPVAARSCGFGERDRRVIDPPPIVQLFIDDPETSLEETNKRMRFQFAVLHCSIWNEAGDQDSSAMPEDYRQQRRLMGTLVSSPFIGLDENGNEGCFFCFPDLSCRTPGAFRLKFALVVLDPLAMRAGGSSPVVASVMSNIFTVYNAKDFPGMQASTALTRRLKEQGCLISIKKGNDKTNMSHPWDENNGEGEGRNGTIVGRGSRKRAKRY